jgi:predicted flap endonuclease-1-like 5' DNA nuclease
MFSLNIFNEDILLIAETLAIVIGSMLMGILLSYFHWSGFKKRVIELTNSLDLEREQAEELKNQLRQLTAVKGQLQNQIAEGSSKQDAQAKKIFDQQQQLFGQQQALTQIDALHSGYKTQLDELNSVIDSYQHRLRVIEEELLKARSDKQPTKKQVAIPATRANYEHVSKLLGKQVTENDLTLINGIGPKTAALLQANGITTWESLANTSAEILKRILSEAGGIYKSLDPTHWPKQAFMAARSEWRKLRVFQESIKKNE